MLDRLVGIILAANPIPAEVLEDDLLEDDLGFDSLDLVELVNAVEQEFRVNISDDEMAEFQTVGDVLTFVRANGE